MKKFDVIIVGGSFVGLIIAGILAKAGLKCALLERNELGVKSHKTGAGRLLAIVHNSYRLLKKFSIISNFNSIGQPVYHIRVLDDDSHSYLDFAPQDIGLESFGYMIDEHVLLSTLLKYVNSLKNVEVFRSTEVINIKQDENLATVITNKGDKLAASLVVASDGKDSKIRKLLGCEVKQLDYKQHGIVFDVEHEKNHQGVAIEKFMREGPFAILPKKGGKYSSVVWSVENNIVPAIKSIDEKMFLNLVEERFGDWLGKIKIVGDIKFFPLKLIYSTQYYEGRVVFLGDALHSIHPLAGQGLNLALRDLEVLAKQVVRYRDLGLDIGSSIMLEEYKSEREYDNNLMIESMNCLNFVFSNNFLPFKVMRRIGLRVVNHLPMLKKAFIQYGCGLKYARENYQ